MQRVPFYQETYLRLLVGVCDTNIKLEDGSNTEVNIDFYTNDDDGTNGSGDGEDSSGDNSKELTDAKPEDSADSVSVSLISVLLIIGSLTILRRKI